MANDKNPTFFQKGYSSSANGKRLLKSAGWANAGVQAFNMLNNAYGATNDTGNALTSIGGVVGSIPTPYTAAAGTVLGLTGGIINGFTDTVNEDYKDKINSQIANLAGRTSDATDFAGLQKAYADLSNFNIDLGDISNWGSKGMFVSEKNSERTKARNLSMEALRIAKETALGNLAETGRTINQNNFIDQYRNLMSFGGPLHTHGIDWTNGLILVDQGGTHEENPNEGVQMGVAPDGTPNLVEEGEVIWNDYVFSNRVKVPEDVRKKYKLRGSDDMTFADAARKAQKPSAERPNDLIEMRSLEDIMAKLMMEQEKIRSRRNKEGNKFAEGGPFGNIILTPPRRPSRPINWGNPVERAKAMGELPVKFDADYTDILPKQRYSWEGLLSTPNLRRPESIDFDGKDGKDDKKGRTSGKYNPLTALRYAPALGAGIGVFSDLMGWTNKPDYSNADMILNASKGIRDISYKPIGDYLAYRPFDTLFYSNQLASQVGATRRAIRNSSNGNRMTAIAGLLAADYNAQNQLGNLFRQAEEYNLAQREKAATFNRATNMYNSEADLKAQIANAKNREVKIDAAKAAASLRQAADAQSSAARNANLTNLFDSLGNIGREEVMKSWINKNPALYYAISNSGAGTPYKMARGGYLTIKRRK